MDYEGKISSILTDDTLFILESIERKGQRAMLVGGCIRDVLIGKNIAELDIDIATTARPEDIVSAFTTNDVVIVPVGIKYGTVAIVYNGKRYEITTLRKDVQTFGRKAIVEFENSFELDSQRRDFTVNAIYLDKRGVLHDYQNGLEDLKNRRIKFIGDASTRIMEDYLRIFRYFRFLAYCGEYKPDREYLEIISSQKNNLHMLSSERILSELLKLFSIYDSSRIIPLMFEVLDCLFILDSGLLNACLRLNMFDEMSALERMCLLFRCSTVEKDKLIRQYKLPKYIANRVLLNVRNTDANAEKNQRKLKEVSNGYRTFYAKCLVTYMYFSGQLSEEAAKQLLEELMSFCNSEYADFNFKLSLLPEYDLNYEQKKTIMMTTKAFWLESAVKVSTQDCLHFAQQLINEHFLTRKI